MHELISKFLRYMVTGGIAAVVDAGGFALLINVKVSIATAGVVSFLAAAFANYRLTSHFVFDCDATTRCVCETYIGAF